MVDHIQSIKDRPDLRLEATNLQSLCWPCHNAKTNRSDGGFGLPRPPRAMR
jgi:5-methylcytosine-specific restriction protein A